VRLTCPARILIVAIVLAMPGLVRAQADVIDDDRAARFTGKIGEALGVIESRYLRDVDEEDLIAGGIEGLYEQVGMSVPKSILVRLKNIKRQGIVEHLGLLADVRKQLGVRDDLEGRQDLDATLRGMFTRLDKRSVYLDPKAVVRNRMFSVNHTSQIGIIARRDKASGEYVVAATIKASPADRAGVKPGDVLIELRRSPPDGAKVIVKGLAANEFDDLVAGPEGGRVDVVVRRDGKPRTFNLTYEVLQLDLVVGYRRGADRTWDYTIDKDARIAYVRIPHLYGTKTSAELSATLATLADAGLKGLILDLRYNGGGLITQGTGVAEQFVKNGVLAQVQYRTGEAQTLRGKARATYTDFPMICLVNRETASSAELIAACLQDRGRAAILGERTFGKGSMQLHIPFDGAEFRLTTARFRRPSGMNLDREHLADPKAEPWGVTPDRGLTHRLSDKDHAALKTHLAKREWLPTPGEFKDVQLDAAVEWLRGQVQTREAR
jgi:carboxyl-terminal processing protease